MTATTTPVTTPVTGPETVRDSDEQLERRRSELRARQAKVTEAGKELSVLQARLDAVKGSRADAKRRLQEAERLVAGLRKEIKDSAKERTALTREVGEAREALTERERKARTSERKYDQAVLADLLRREKERDLAGTVATPPVGPAASRDDSAGADTEAKANTPAPQAKVTEKDHLGEQATVTERKADATTRTRRTPARGGTTGTTRS